VGVGHDFLRRREGSGSTTKRHQLVATRGEEGARAVSAVACPSALKTE
jgi:hypothetical protein